MPDAVLLFLVFVMLGGIAASLFYGLGKVKQGRFKNFKGKGMLQVLDGLNLSYQTSVYLLEANHQQALVIVHPSGTNVVLLKNPVLGEWFEKAVKTKETAETDEPTEGTEDETKV